MLMLCCGFNKIADNGTNRPKSMGGGDRFKHEHEHELHELHVDQTICFISVNVICRLVEQNTRKIADSLTKKIGKTLIWLG